LLGARRGKLGTYGAGATLAELADLPHVGSVSSLHKASKDRLQAERRRESDVETVFCPLPAVVSIEWGVPLRYPTLPGRLRARRIDIEVDVVEAAAPGRVEVLRTTGPKPRHKLEQRTGPGFDHVLGLLLGGAGGGGGGRELSGDLEDVASQVVTACTRVLQGA
jgi:electron transfer flavoprotein alpha/beta subunit